MANTASMSMSEARAFIKRFQSSPPVNVKEIAENLGLRVWEMSTLPENVSGKLFFNENGGSSGFSIGVNAQEGYLRKRFTVAHELAHFLLHRSLIGNGIEDDALYRSGLSNQLETEANRLAADILMPYSLIERLQKEGVRGVDGLAGKLEVSSAAMKIRLGIPVV